LEEYVFCELIVVQCLSSRKDEDIHPYRSASIHYHFRLSATHSCELLNNLNTLRYQNLRSNYLRKLQFNLRRRRNHDTNQPSLVGKIYSLSLDTYTISVPDVDDRSLPFRIITNTRQPVFLGRLFRRFLNFQLLEFRRSPNTAARSKVARLLHREGRVLDELEPIEDSA